MNMFRNALPLLLCLLLGCATSRPNGVASFKTDLHPIDIKTSGNGLAGDLAQFYYQLQADCEGENCTPKEAELTFSLTTGSTDLYLSNHNISIQADDKQFEWKHKQWINIENSPPVSGTIISVTLDFEALKTIATADTVTGLLASYPFKWSYKNRKPLRTLLEQIKNYSN